jgi:hypothetical protein
MDFAGSRLLLERLVLVGFDYAGPGSAAPVLWPAGILQSSGNALNLTDVQLVTSSPDVFSSWLKLFAGDSRVPYWTVRCSCCVQQAYVLSAASVQAFACIAVLLGGQAWCWRRVGLNHVIAAASAR